MDTYRDKQLLNEAVSAYKTWQEWNQRRLAALDRASRAGWLGKELAQAIGVEPSTVSRALRSHRNQPIGDRFL